MLGIIGEAEYALGVCGTISGALAGEVFRRPASHAGTYGGWRWECSPHHAREFRSDPLLGQVWEGVQRAEAAHNEAALSETADLEPGDAGYSF